MKWLNGHTSRSVYDQNPDKVTKLCHGVGKDKTKFEKLSGNKNLVLLTRAPMGNKCMATFYHSVMRIPILPDDLHYVALSNMQTGTGVELDPASLFTSTAAVHVPALLDLMKIKTEKDSTISYPHPPVPRRRSLGSPSSHQL